METRKKKKHIARNILIGLLVVAVIAGIGITSFLKKLTVAYPEITDHPKPGEWYRVTPMGSKSADGSEWHGLIRLGTENRVLLYFNGGGVSFNEETSGNSPDWFFFPNTALQDFNAGGGIFRHDDKNPFRNWTFVVVEYATGDFHSGQGEVTVKDDDGSERIVYHNGYNNYTLLMKEILPLIGKPDSLVITGSSAGGFATALLSDDVIQYFPDTKNITSCVDSSLLYYDGWKQTADNIWHAPEGISEKLTGNNLTLDSLVALQEKHSDVKILFTCSVRDQDLQRYQAYLEKGRMEVSKEQGDRFQAGLQKMVSDMQSQLRSPGIYIFEGAKNNDNTSTQHMVLPMNVFDKLSEGKSVADWLMDAVNGDVRSYGLSLLEN